VLSAKILFIDDNPSDVEFFRLALKDQAVEEFNLDIISDGAQALEFIHNQRDSRVDARPWVVLLDLHLPKHDGIEILRTIRDEPALNHIAVVVLTGGASRREEEEIRRLGAHWRPKPIQLSGFAELAAEVIAICKGLRSGGDSARKSSAAAS
jgi:CheY-like chemotaxis protein